MDNLPGARPTCRHGNPVGGVRGCSKCYYEDKLINEKLKPLADTFWDQRGRRSIETLLYRAYRMGMNDSKEN